MQTATGIKNKLLRFL